MEKLRTYLIYSTPSQVKKGPENTLTHIKRTTDLSRNMFRNISGQKLPETQEQYQTIYPMRNTRVYGIPGATLKIDDMQVR